MDMVDLLFCLGDMNLLDQPEVEVFYSVTK